MAAICSFVPDDLKLNTFNVSWMHLERSDHGCIIKLDTRLAIWWRDDFSQWQLRVLQQKSLVPKCFHIDHAGKIDVCKMADRTDLVKLKLHHIILLLYYYLRILCVSQNSFLFSYFLVLCIVLTVKSDFDLKMYWSASCGVRLVFLSEHLFPHALRRQDHLALTHCSHGASIDSHWPFFWVDSTANQPIVPAETPPLILDSWGEKHQDP